MSRIAVGIAEVRTGGPADVLAAIGLGSCVAVAIHDPVLRRGALAHIMLPRRADGLQRPGENTRKYADAAIPEAIRALELVGCRRADLAAKIAGGASIFAMGGGDPGSDIGGRNAEAVARVLDQEGVPLLAADVGGREGRTVEFVVGTGELVVRTIRGPHRCL